MKCLKCGYKTIVITSRSNGYIRLRERQCKMCGYIFTTREEPTDLGGLSLPMYLNRMIEEIQSEMRGSEQS